MMPVRGVLAAGVTPLRDDGSKIDGDAIGALYAFYAAVGLDGVLALGTTGEGILLDSAERKLVTRLAVEASDIPVLVHVGAQTRILPVARALLPPVVRMALRWIARVYR